MRKKNTKKPKKTYKYKVLNYNLTLLKDEELQRCSL